MSFDTPTNRDIFCGENGTSFPELCDETNLKSSKPPKEGFEKLFQLMLDGSLEYLVQTGLLFFAILFIGCICACQCLFWACGPCCKRCCKRCSGNRKLEKISEDLPEPQDEPPIPRLQQSVPLPMAQLGPLAVSDAPEIWQPPPLQQERPIARSIMQRMQQPLHPQPQMPSPERIP